MLFRSLAKAKETDKIYTYSVLLSEARLIVKTSLSAVSDFTINYTVSYYCSSNFPSSERSNVADYAPTMAYAYCKVGLLPFYIMKQKKRS